MPPDSTQVELPDVLAVLAHEIRSPLTVLQGYIRLLQRERPAGDPEAAMLAAMLDATGRLATLGRQASDLAMFLRPTADTWMVLTAAQVAAELAKRAPDAIGVVDRLDAARDRIRVRASGTLLASAICALADLVMRESGSRTATIVAAGDASVLRFDVCAGSVSEPPRAADTADARPIPFTSGGLGLALVLASYVLAAHRARVARAAGGDITVELVAEDVPA